MVSKLKMKLIQYFEEVFNIDDTNPKIIKYVNNFAPNISLIINKTNKLQPKNVLKINLKKIINYLSNIFFQKLKPIIDKLEDKEKNQVIDYNKKFNETLNFLNNETKTFLENLEFSNEQLSDENKKLLIEIFFSCFILYKIMKEIEKRISQSFSDQKFFNDSFNVLFSIFEKGDAFKSIIDEKSEVFFRKGLGLLKPFSTNKFHKEIKKDNKEYKEKVEKTKNIQSFYLKYIGNKKAFDFTYMCYSPDETGSFLIPDTTPYDLYFEEYSSEKSDVNEFILLESSLNDKQTFFNQLKNPKVLNNLKQIFTFSNLDKLPNSSKVKVIPFVKKIKLDDNKKINLKEIIPIAQLTFI